MSQVTVRPAREDEIPQLQGLLYRHRDYFEFQNLRQAIVFVAEYEGEIVGMITGRMIWQVPTLLIDRQAKLTRHARRRATYTLIRELDRWIGDRSRNVSGIYSYFCVIKGATMKQLAKSFGMLRLYERFATFGKDL